MLALLNRWKAEPNGPTNASAFMRVLESPRSSNTDKVAILRAFNNWDILVSTWFEVAHILPAIERVLDEPQFPERSQAALLISKVYFCLEQYQKALEFALRGEFNVVPAEKTGLGNDGEYVNKIIEVAIDTYKSLKNTGTSVPDKLNVLVNNIINRNVKKGEYWHVIALGIETKSVETITRAVEELPNEMLPKHREILAQTLQLIENSGWPTTDRFKVIEIVLKKMMKSPEVDMDKVRYCLLKTNNSQEVADTIIGLLAQSKNAAAYQIALDLYANGTQRFLEKVMQRLEESTAKPADPVPMERIHSILNGHETIKAHLDFFVRHNHTDSGLLEEFKEHVRTASGHNALLIANGLMQYGTTCDDFLRNNLPWVSKATNWNKFNAVASLGLIHHGQEAAALKVLDPYLPKDATIDGMGFKEGGAMYAYGLIHAKHGDATAMSTLAQWLKSAENEPVRHGSCLGYGLAGLGSSSMPAYEKVREVLTRDEAVSGEAAGIAMGLIMAGSLNEEVFNELKQYTIDTQHDKTQRGIRTGLACAAFGLQDGAEKYIDEAMKAKSNPMLRSTGVCMLAMAYAGTGDPNVVRRLLEKVATDPNLDVKRYATIGIGFVLSKDPSTCLLYIGMLTEHFNGHVRYGAAMALGIACAGSGNMEAIALIEPMMSDKEGFVRNGALLALALIMCQQTDYTCPKVNGFRKQLVKKANEKNEDSLVKFGAIVAQGLLDIGGQNAALFMHNSDGQPDMGSMVGMMCFLHGWFWHSMHYFIALAAKPSCLVLVNENLKIPEVEFTCNANSMKFAYPPASEGKKDKDVKKVETVVLSISGKKSAAKKAAAAMAVAAANEKKRQEEEKMELDTKPPKKTVIDVRPAHNLKNPARVIPSQREFMVLADVAGYKPMKQLSKGGIVVAKRLDTTKEETFVAEVVSKTQTTTVTNPDPKPHSTFEINITEQ